METGTTEVTDAPSSRRPVVLLALGIHDPALQEGIAEWARENEWELDFSFARHGILPFPGSCDGVLTTVNNRRMAKWLEQFNCPVVRMLEAPVPKLSRTTSHFPSVTYDGEAAGRLGAEHLLSLGRPSFVFCQTSGSVEAGYVRRGFMKAMRATGQKAALLDFLADHPEQSRNQAQPRDLVRGWLEDKLSNLPLPAAVMAEDDRCALDLMAAARALGLRVPADLAILGNQNQQLQLDSSPVGVSSVDVNLHGVGYQGARLLGKLMAGGVRPQQSVVVQPSRVVARASTDLYVGPHRGVSQAMRYIRENFREPLTVDRVAKAVGMTGRGLQKALQNEAGLTLVKEITRLRLEAAMRLLEDSEANLNVIAAETGLTDAKNLCRLFQRCHGITPRKWRVNKRRAIPGKA